MSLLNFNFVMVYIIHEVLILLKNHLNYLEDSVFKCFFKDYNKLFFFLKKNVFSKHMAMKILCLEEENIIKDIRNLFRLINKNKIKLELKI